VMKGKSKIDKIKLNVQFGEMSRAHLKPNENLKLRINKIFEKHRIDKL